MRHIHEEEIERFVSGRLEPAAFRQAVRHLLTGCEACRARMAAYAVVLFEADPPWVRLLRETAYDAVLDRAIAAALQQEPRWQEEKERLADLLAAARACPEGITGLPQDDLAGWALAEALLELSRDARFRDPEEMRLLAFLATVAARNLDPKEYPPALIADLNVRAWAELANAYRINEDYEASEEAFERAADLLDDGTGDVLLLARLLDLHASLRKDQRRLPEALQMLDSAHRLYFQVGETHLAGRALISKGIDTALDGRPEDAARHLRVGLEMIEPASDPQLAAIAQYNLVNSLTDCGNFHQAGEILLESGLRQAFASDPLNLLRLRWLEGKIFAGLGKLRRAERALAEVRTAFLDRDMDYVAAMVGLELAGVWLRQGKTAEVRDLAREILQTFRRLEIETEAVKALRYFHEACRRDEATPRLAERVAGFLRRLEWAPQLRFAP